MTEISDSLTFFASHICLGEIYLDVYILNNSITIVDSTFVFKVHVKYEAKQTETESSVIFLADFMQQKSVYTHILYKLPALYIIASVKMNVMSSLLLITLHKTLLWPYVLMSGFKSVGDLC